MVIILFLSAMKEPHSHKMPPKWRFKAAHISSFLFPFVFLHVFCFVSNQ